MAFSSVRLTSIAHENLDNILDGHGIENNIHECQPNTRKGHLCTKISSKTMAIVGHCILLLIIQFPFDHYVNLINFKPVQYLNG